MILSFLIAIAKNEKDYIDSFDSNRKEHKLVKLFLELFSLSNKVYGIDYCVISSQRDISNHCLVCKKERNECFLYLSSANSDYIMPRIF